MDFLGNVFSKLTINKNGYPIRDIINHSDLLMIKLTQMNFIDYSKKLDAVLHLVEIRATGRPEELANRLNVSEKTARRMINHLKQRGLSIKYCRINQSYTLN